MAAHSSTTVTAPLRVVPSAASVPVGSVDDAHAQVAANALVSAPVGAVGLELEMHVVDLTEPARRISWRRLTDIVAAIAPMPCGSPVTIEPGGQLELSTVPKRDITTALAALAADHRALAAALTSEDLGLVALGTDPARPSQRMSPQSRYVAMEAHFAAIGSAHAGLSMMCSTAALQVNIDAGTAADWPERVSRCHRLAPVLVAISACSPWLAGQRSGWRSMRQQMWGDIDQSRCGPLLDGRHPADEWASYALMAPVMMVRDPSTSAVQPVTERVSFADWVAAPTRLGWAPTLDDLDYHLSTLWPPIRPRGYLEIRCLDAVPPRWLPGLAGIAVTLLDDPIAADRAAEACEPVAGAWTEAARDGLSDPAIAKAASTCVEAAVDRAPVLLKAPMAAYAELVNAGRTPGDEIAERSAHDGPLAVLETLAAEAVARA